MSLVCAVGVRLFAPVYAMCTRDNLIRIECNRCHEGIQLLRRNLGGRTRRGLRRWRLLSAVGKGIAGQNWVASVEAGRRNFLPMPVAVTGSTILNIAAALPIEIAPLRIDSAAQPAAILCLSAKPAPVSNWDVQTWVPREARQAVLPTVRAALEIVRLEEDRTRSVLVICLEVAVVTVTRSGEEIEGTTVQVPAAAAVVGCQVCHLAEAEGSVVAAVAVGAGNENVSRYTEH